MTQWRYDRLTWPEMNTAIARKPQPVVALTGTSLWVSGGRIAEKLMAARVKDRREALEGALEAMMPEEPTKADLEKAQARKDAYLAELAADGEVLRAAITAALGRAAKKGGAADVGWCANPVALGGCAGENVTDAVLATLVADKKFAKDIAGLTAE